MQDQGDFIAYPVSATLWVRKNAKDKVLSDTMVVLHNEDHVFIDFKVEGLDGYVIKFNERKRTITARKVLTAPKPEASTIDKEFASMAGGDSFTLDDGPSAEDKFKAVCKERGYDADLSARVREIIKDYGASEAVKNRLNDLLKARKAKVMRKEDWAVAQELTAK